MKWVIAYFMILAFFLVGAIIDINTILEEIKIIITVNTMPQEIKDVVTKIHGIDIEERKDEE